MNRLIAILIFSAVVLAMSALVGASAGIGSGEQPGKQRPRSTDVLSASLIEWQEIQKRGSSAENYFRKLVRQAFNEGSDAAYSMLWALVDSADSASVASAVDEARLVFGERAWPRESRQRFSLWFMAWYERMPKDVLFKSGSLGYVLYVSHVEEVRRLIKMLDDRRLSLDARGSLFLAPLQLGWSGDVMAFGDGSEELASLWQFMERGEDELRAGVIIGVIAQWPDNGRRLLETAERTRPRWWVEAIEGKGPLASVVKDWTHYVDSRSGRRGRK